MILADTGYFVALLDAGDQSHRAAMAWADAVAEPVLVTEYVLVEAVNHFSRANVRARAQVLIEAVLFGNDYLFVPASPDLLRGGLAMFRGRQDKDWSLTDCISFALMRDRGITRALAFDHHFAQAGFDALLRRDP